MNIQSQNYFKLPNPELLYCTVWQYQAHLGGGLVIRVHEGTLNTLYWLKFTKVVFFEGAMEWESANFNLGENRELSRLTNYWQLAKNIPEERILERVKLFQVTPRTDTDIEFDMKIHVIAERGYVDTKFTS